MKLNIKRPDNKMPGFGVPAQASQLKVKHGSVVCFVKSSFDLSFHPTHPTTF